MHTKNQQEHPGMRLSAHGLHQLGEQGRQRLDYILVRLGEAINNNEKK